MRRQLYELQQKQSLPLELKTIMTQKRIRDQTAMAVSVVYTLLNPCYFIACSFE